eukprot:227714-Rhodomonas_salina.3
MAFSVSNIRRGVFSSSLCSTSRNAVARPPCVFISIRWNSVPFLYLYAISRPRTDPVSRRRLCRAVATRPRNSRHRSQSTSQSWPLLSSPGP